MSENKLPVENGIFNRVKRAISVLRGEDTYAKLHEHSKEIESQKLLLLKREQIVRQKEQALVQRQQGLDKRELSLHQFESELKQQEQWLNERKRKIELEENEIQTTRSTIERQESTASQKANLYAEQQKITPKMPEIQVHAIKCVSNRFQDLQRALEEVAEQLENLRGTEMAEEEKEMIVEEYSFLKGKLLGEMAVLMETMTPKEISTTIIGEKKVTIGMLAEQLPEILGIVEPTEQGDYTFAHEKSKTSEQNHAIASSWISGLLDSYSGGLMELYKIGFLKGSTHDLADFTSHLDRETYSDVSWILNNYFGVHFEPEVQQKINETRKSNPLRNFTKPQQIDEINISNNPVVGKVMDQMGNIKEEVTEIDR